MRIVAKAGLVLGLLMAALASASIGVRSAAVEPRAQFPAPLAVRASSNKIAAFTGSDGQVHLAYELYITNYGHWPIRLASLRLTGTAPPNKSEAFAKGYGASELGAMFSLVGGNRMMPQDPVLDSSQAGIVFVFLGFPSIRAVPQRIINQLEVETPNPDVGKFPIAIEPIMVSGAGAIVLQSPLRGARWMAGNGPSNTSLHRRAILILNGKPKIGQRFAIDWVQVGADGRTWSGDERRNQSYHAYNAPVLAAAAGRIVSVKDGIPENVPNSEARAVMMSTETIAGNYVIEDLGGGRYAAYAHLRPGSIAVKPGERVHAGQRLGRLGNSGSSTEPHLHFQVCDAPSIIQSSGLPFLIDSFTLEEYRIEPKNDQPAKLERKGAHQVKDSLPMEDALTSFNKK